MTKATSFSAALLLTTALLLSMGGSAAAQHSNNPRYQQFRDTAAAAISTPAAGNVRLFFDSTGFYWKNSSGTSTAVGGTLSGLTTGVVPQAGSATTIVNSKMVTSGTNSGTWTLYDSTVGSGLTSLVIRAGDVGASWPTHLIDIQHSNGASMGGFVANGGTISVWADDYRNPSGDYFQINGSAYNAFIMNSAFTLRWTSGGASVAGDIGLARSAAGILKVTDGSTGQGGIGISDAATATVSDALILRHATSGTAAASFGTGLLFQGEDAGGNMQDMGSIDAVYSVATNGAETTGFVFSTFLAGTEATGAMRLDYVTNQAKLHAPVNFSLLSDAGYLEINAGGANPIYATTNGTVRWSVLSTGHLEPYADNTYDIGTSALKVKDSYLGTSIQGTRTKTLTDNTITDVVQISSTAGANANGVTAGHVSYTIIASDATTDLVQTEVGQLPFLLVNENGTVTVTLGTVGVTAIDSAGGAALANTFASSVSGTNAKIRVTSNYDQATLTGTVTHTIEYRVYIDSGTATVTPQ